MGLQLLEFFLPFGQGSLEVRQGAVPDLGSSIEITAAFGPFRLGFEFFDLLFDLPNTADLFFLEIPVCL